MHDWLTHRAAATPAATAVVDAADGDRQSYADLDGAVDRLAGHLSALGVDGDDHLGFVLSRRSAAVELYWAAMRLGCVAVPLAPDWEASTLRARLDAADVTALVCDERTEETALSAADAGDGPVPVASVDEPTADRVARLSSQSTAAVAPATWMGSDPMTVAFTAGATGEPKPVRLRLENHFASAVDASFRFGVVPTDRWLVTQPFHHVCGFAPLLRATLYGAALVLPAEADPGALADTLTTHGVTALSTSPTTLRGMLDARGTLADSLRLAVVSGAPAPEGLFERCRQYSVPAFVAYTLTEAAGEVAAASAEALADTPGSVGRPLLRSSVTVVGDDGTGVSAGETGDLVVSGPSVADGYHGDPPDSATGAPDPDRGVATGDRGYLDESGRLWVLSRRADDIRVDGQQVRATDVSAVLREHDAVADAAVVGLSDDDGQRVAALVVPQTDAPSVPALEKHCRARLADFVAPNDIGFATELPRTASGAIDRDAVARRLREATEGPSVTTPADGSPARNGGSTGDTGADGTDSDAPDGADGAGGDGEPGTGSGDGESEE
jgi:O-succinylbenzoic acid--CoA ligase